jgi:hypothetical protein
MEQSDSQYQENQNQHERKMKIFDIASRVAICTIAHESSNLNSFPAGYSAGFNYTLPK